MAFICVVFYKKGRSRFETLLYSSFCSCTLSSSLLLNQCTVHSFPLPLETDIEVTTRFFTAQHLLLDLHPAQKYYVPPPSLMFCRVASCAPVLSEFCAPFPLHHCAFVPYPSPAGGVASLSSDESGFIFIGNKELLVGNLWFEADTFLAFRRCCRCR